MSVKSSVRSKFLDSVLDLLSRTESRRIQTAEDLSAVIRLRYGAYVQGGLIEANPSGMSFDAYDLLENCQIFGIYLEGALLSSIRIHHVTSNQPWSPAYKSFSEYLSPRLEAGETFIDGSRFCVSPEVKGDFTSLPFLTVRLAYMASVHFGSTYNISVVRREHGAFYRRYYGFERWAGDVDLDWYKRPVDLYVGDMRVNQEQIDQRLPFMQSSFEERAMLFSDELVQQGLTSVVGLHGGKVSNSMSLAPVKTQLENIARLSG
jgi:hypothetical protein